MVLKQVFFGVLLAALFYYWALVCWHLLRSIGAMNWIKTEAKIHFNSSVVVEGKKYDRRYFHYIYRVNDIEYHNNEVGFGLSRYNGLISRLVYYFAMRKYPDISIRYCPTDPNLSVVYTGIPLHLVYPFLVSSALLMFFSSLVPKVFVSLGFNW
jgi:hypothetical protein